MLQFVTVCLLAVVAGCTQVASAQSDYYRQPADLRRDTSTFQPLANPLPKARTLLKAGASLPLFRQSSFTGYYVTIALDATAEQKLVGGLSLLAGLETNAGISLNDYRTQFFSVEMPVALRYYFSLTRREKERIDRHSFFSNYVALQTNNVLFSNLTYRLQGRLYDLQRYQRGNVGRVITNSGSVGDRFLFLNYAFLQLGTQRRVLSRSYLDVNVVIPIAALLYNRYDYTLATPPLINLKLGVGKCR